MWRSAKSSFSRYTLEMAEILCRCLKSPHRENAIARYKLNVKQTEYKNGVAQPPRKFPYRQYHNNFTDAFGTKGQVQ
ncbi:mitochondrial ATP synthase epsilon [Babesia ovis]|uniref:Mitochondrial ATP synthase epsilon n=1 Tax=Babesia ovis TaxID=5869 RepID=A0A9W5TAL5_BABOV|nr:mitochondrial ATP synthase epsilon [Babesia ovis]